MKLLPESWRDWLWPEEKEHRGISHFYYLQMTTALPNGKETYPQRKVCVYCGNVRMVNRTPDVW